MKPQNMWKDSTLDALFMEAVALRSGVRAPESCGRIAEMAQRSRPSEWIDRGGRETSDSG